MLPNSRLVVSVVSKQNLLISLLQLLQPLTYKAFSSKQIHVVSIYRSKLKHIAFFRLVYLPG